MASSPSEDCVAPEVERSSGFGGIRRKNRRKLRILAFGAGEDSLLLLAEKHKLFVRRIENADVTSKTYISYENILNAELKQLKLHKYEDKTLAVSWLRSPGRLVHHPCGGPHRCLHQKHGSEAHRRVYHHLQRPF